MNVRIGINPLTWSNDDLPALGDDVPLETCLAEAAAAGYVGVELGRKFPRRAEELGPLLERHGLALVSGWYSLRLLERTPAEELAAMQPHLELLAALGSDVMVCAEVTGCVHGDRRARLSRRPRLDADRWRQLTRRLDELGERMAVQGVRLAFHHHMGTVVQSETEIDALMSDCGEAVWLLLDTGHLAYAGGDPCAVAERHGGRIAHVHCKDVRLPVLRRVLNGDTSFLEAVLQGVFTVPGDGDLDFAAVLAVLRRHRYRGWLVVEAEQDPAIAHPATHAAIGYDCLSRLTARG